MLNRYRLSEELHKQFPEITPRQAIQFTDKLFDLIKEEILNGNDVHIKGFGRFYLKTIKSRMGWSFKKNGKAMLDPINIMRFRATETFKRKIRR